MTTTERRPLPTVSTGIGRRDPEKWSHQVRPTSTRRGLNLLRSHSTTLLFIVGWTVLCSTVYLAFTGDQARSGTWGCQLPRMYPVYRRLEPPIPGSRYDTFLYREGNWDADIPSGSPVIFLPGHAGDYKQARSVASSLARQFYGDQRGTNYEVPHWSRPADVWAVHYNEDFTAIHAPTLLDQATYLVSVIPRVLAAYKYLPERQRPKTVTLLGHSMGGVVARLAVRLAPELPVDAIVTIATPHQLPPANLEFGMERLYRKVNTPSSDGGVDPVMISICGGVADTQIVSDSCTLPDFIGPHDGFTVFSSGVPVTWTNVEHQAIVWCDQVRWRVARILLDMNSEPTKQGKLSAAKRWLQGTSILNGTGPPPAVVKKLSPATHANMTYIVRLRSPTPTQVAEPPFSLFSCDLSASCERVAGTAQVIPYPGDTRLPFPLPGEGIRNEESAFAISINNVDRKTTVEIGGDDEFEVLATGAHLQIQAVSGRWTDLTGATDATRISLHYPSVLMSSLLAWRLQLVTESCTGRPPITHFQSRSLQTASVSEESRFYLGTNSSMVLHSHISGAPFQGGQQHSYGLHVDVYQQPGCVVDQLRLKFDVLASIAKITLRLRVAAIVWAIGWSAAILYRQLSALRATEIVPNLSSVLASDIPRALLAVSAVSILAMVVQGVMPSTASYLLIGDAHWYLVPVAMGLAIFSLGLTIVVAVWLRVAVSLGSKVIGTSTPPSSVAENTIALRTRVLFAAMLLLLVKLVIPLGIAFIALYMIMFISTCRSASWDQTSRHRIIFSTLLLMTLLLPFHGLSLAVWGRNVWAEIGHPFDEDHAVLPLIPLLLVVEQSTRESVFLSKDPRISRVAQFGSLLLAAIAFILGPRRPFLLPTTSSALFLAVFAVLGGLAHFCRTNGD